MVNLIQISHKLYINPDKIHFVLTELNSNNKITSLHLEMEGEYNGLDFNEKDTIQYAMVALGLRMQGVHYSDSL